MLLRYNYNDDQLAHHPSSFHFWLSPNHQIVQQNKSLYMNNIKIKGTLIEHLVAQQTQKIQIQVLINENKNLNE